MSLVGDAGLDSLHTTLGCLLSQTKPSLTRSLNRVEHISKKAFLIRTTSIEKLRTVSPSIRTSWNSRFQELAETEKVIQDFIQPASEDLKALQKDSIGQLSFQDEYFKCFNFVPFVLLGMSLFKIWAVPLMALLTPLIAWIVPYIFLKFMYKLPISSEQYGDILKLIWSGSPFPMKPGADGRLTIPPISFFTPRSLIQGAVFVFSFAQGLIQPIQNAYHLYKTDQTILENGEKVIRVYQTYKSFMIETQNLGLKFPFRDSLQDMEITDPRRAIHLLMEQPERFQIALRDLADLEILWRIANCESLNPATVIENGKHPLFQADGMVDISLPSETAVSSAIDFTGRSHHAALTGPNGGGKSSFLRSTLQCVLLAQAYGVSPAETLIIRRFGWISSGLRLQDSPGTLSMFETEVWFASNLLGRSSERGPGLVLYDELFHSTNPPDGIETARIFLDRLWKKTDVVSIVSTHVFDLVEKAPESVQRLCCSARTRDDGIIEYGYAVETGICRISSVRSIWKRFRLSAADPPI
jgi:hypothetical protein